MSAKTSQKSSLHGRRKASAKPMRKSRATGSLTRPETTKLVMQAQEAFHYQTALRQIEPGTKFDDWRRDQVMDAVGLPGISKIGRSHFRSVLAHFLTLSGREDEAFELLNRTGKKRHHGDPTDTHESAEAIVSHIRSALADHSKAIVTDPKGHIHIGWFLTCARQRTGKPTLTMDTLAERLNPNTLLGLLSHLRNHISRREGREDTTRRQPRRYPKPADPGDFEPDPF